MYLPESADSWISLGQSVHLTKEVRALGLAIVSPSPCLISLSRPPLTRCRFPLKPLSISLLFLLFWLVKFWTTQWTSANLSHKGTDITSENIMLFPQLCFMETSKMLLFVESCTAATWPACQREQRVHRYICGMFWGTGKADVIPGQRQTLCWNSSWTVVRTWLPTLWFVYGAIQWGYGLDHRKYLI